MPQLDPTWFASQLFWLAITFCALYFVLSRLVLPPLMEVMARRAQTMSGDVENAQSMKLQAEAAKADYERTMAQARDKTQSLMNDVTLGSKAKAEQSAKDLDQQVAKKLSEASTKIAAKKEELKQLLTPATAELAGLIVSRLTQQAPANDRAAAVVDEISKQRKV